MSQSEKTLDLSRTQSGSKNRTGPENAPSTPPPSGGRPLPGRGLAALLAVGLGAGLLSTTDALGQKRFENGPVPGKAGFTQTNVGQDAGPESPSPNTPAVASPENLDTWTDPTTGMAFARIPEGCFQMGSDRDEIERDDDESPYHQVCLDEFWMGQFEVTNAQFRRFQSGHDSGDYQNNDLNGDDQPVVRVSWNEAQEFAGWMSEQSEGRFRLPTEAEWEYAARAGTTTPFYWGDEIDPAYVNFSDRNDPSGPSTMEIDDGYAVSAPVGRYLPNQFGLYDVLGNVMEWVQDVYSNRSYAEHAEHNPVFEDARSGAKRVTRGGGWYDQRKYIRVAFRYTFEPDTRHHVQGFRLVRVSP